MTKRHVGSVLISFLAMVVAEFAAAAERTPISSFQALDLKDQISSVAAILGVLITVFGVFRGLAVARKSNRLRQAAVAKEVLKDLFTDPLGRSAMQMLDWDGRTFQAGPNSQTVHWVDLQPALVIPSSSTQFNVKQQFIRDCFENLFDHLLMIDHLISIENIHYDDIRIPVQYYAAKLSRHPLVFDPFLLKYGYAKAHGLIHRLAKDYAAHSEALDSDRN
ncbi:hypothetical protein VY732_16765 [Pseudomonas sp. ZY71]|uniref:hypothetical protein n=1 Tax=Pseudomonas sp. ZY71 TaxID=3115647 RepID=UPI002F41A979